MLSKIVRRFARLVCLLAIVLVGLGGAGILLPRWTAQDAEDSKIRTRILVLSNPIHTDLAIPVDDALRERFSFLQKAGLDLNLQGVQYLIIGWGGRDFYTQTPRWADLKAGPVLKSITLDRSVMHMELGGDIDPAAAYVTPVAITREGLERMIQFVLASFQQGPDGPVVIPGAGYGPYDAFYEANGYFNMILGCNNWTAAALRQAGLTTGWWMPLPWNVRMSLRLHNPESLFAL